MTPAPASVAYRKAALQQASTVGLVIALYDTLAGDLSRAASALEQNDIETRCKELSHGFRVLQQLDAMLDIPGGGQAALNIRRFYTHLRGQMLTAQFKRDPAILRNQVRITLEVREAWQQIDNRTALASELSKGMQASSMLPPHLSTSTEEQGRPSSERNSFSCSG